MRPIDFEDARDQYGSYEFERWLERSTIHVLRQEEAKRKEEKRRFDRHPRTCISRFLFGLANRISLDEGSK